MSELLIYVNERSGGMASCEVILDVADGEEPNIIEVEVVDQEPDDVWGPIVQRAVETAGWDFYVEEATRVDGLDTTAFRVRVPAGVTGARDLPGLAREPDLDRLRAHMIAHHEETAEDLDAILAEMREQAATQPEHHKHYVGKPDVWLLNLIHDRQHTSLDWDAGHDEEDMDVDPTPCCSNPGCPGRGSGTCDFPGYADNH